MAEDIKKEDVVDNPEDVIIEPDVVTISPGLVDGPGPGILEKIASVFRKPKEEDEPEDKPDDEPTDEPEDKPEDEPTDKPEDEPEDKLDDEPKEKVEYTEIDPRFVNTAGTYGWSRERIIEYAENHDDLDVVEMTTRMEKSIKDNRASDIPKSDDTFINEEALKTLAEKDAGLAQAVRDILDPLAKRFEDTSSELDTLKGDLGKYESDRKAKDGVRDLEIANGIFDGSGISSLGKTKDIPKYPDGTYNLSNPMVKERGKIWDIAQQFYANGGTFEGAVNNALQWYRGSDANKEMKRKVIKDLKEQEERVMPKRQEAKVETEYASEEERKAAVINDAIRKYNVEL